MANQDPLLLYEEFVERQNKFHMHFVGQPGAHAMGDIYRRKSNAYQECMGAHPVEFEKLRSELQAMHYDGNTLFFGLTYRKKLYDAYVMMHPYAKRNCELFR
jgi:hypothetical protein